MRIDTNSVTVEIKAAPVSLLADLPFRALFTVISEGSKLIYMKIQRANEHSPNSICMTGGVHDCRTFNKNEPIEYIGQVIVDAQRNGEVVKVDPTQATDFVKIQEGDSVVVQCRDDKAIAVVTEVSGIYAKVRYGIGEQAVQVPRDAIIEVRISANASRIQFESGDTLLVRVSDGFDGTAEAVLTSFTDTDVLVQLDPDTHDGTWLPREKVIRNITRHP